jgi:hypothetical protein
VIREYVGTGRLAELAAEEDAEQRAIREQERRERRQQRAAAKALARQVRDFYGRVEEQSRAIYRAAGFRRHHQGEWRKPRMKAITAEQREMTDVERRQVLSLLQRAEEGEALATELAREKMREYPHLWDLFDLARGVQRTLIGSMSGPNALLKEAVRRQVDQMRAELEGPNPTALERLLVERVITCWLQTYYEDAQDAQRRQQSGLTSDGALKMLQRAEVAQRRFLAAVKALAQIRRLALPLVQVNVAGQQIVANVGQQHEP